MEYDAFVSYRRSDGARAAKWLRRELERFRLPRRLRQHQRRLKVFLDTAYERGTSDFYENTIRPALLASRHLIVIATPDAVRRPAGAQDWIAREIADFAAGPNGNNFMVVRAAGGFDDALPGDLAERFPNIEIADLRGLGRFWYLQPARAARLSNEKLKLVAPLIDLAPADMPLLRQEEERAQQVRMGTAAGVALASAVTVSALSIYALTSQQQAQQALDRSMFATGRMIISVAAELERGGALGEERSNLINGACDLLDRLRREATQESRVDARAVCLVERALERQRLDEPAEAERLFDEAVKLTSVHHRTTGRVADAQSLLRVLHDWVDFVRPRKETDAVEAVFAASAPLLQEVVAVHEKEPDVLERAAEVYARLADGFHEAGNSEGGLAAVGDMLPLLDKAAEWSLEEDKGRLIHWQARILTVKGEREAAANRLGEALESYQGSIDLRQKLDDTGDLSESERLDTAFAHAQMARLLVVTGESAKARAAEARAREAIARLEAAAELSEGGAERLNAIAAGLDELAAYVARPEPRQ